jgi:dCTP deaminase
MILPDHEIRKLLKEGRLVIEPMNDPETQIQPNGVDVRLGNEFRIFKIISTPFIDTKKEVKDYTERIVLGDSEPFIIHPGEFVLASLKEYIKMPPDLMGSVDGKSSLGRLGIAIHATSASINPGWEGKFVLEITNMGKMPVALYPNMRIAKLVLHKLSSECERPYNVREDCKYNKQESVTESRIYKEAEGENKMHSEKG